MPRTKPTAARRRAEQQMRRIAEEFRVARATAGLTRPEIARRAGVSPSTVERIERAATGVAVGTLVSALSAIGLDLVLQAYPSGGFQLRDARHAEMAEILIALASPAMRARAEVSAGEHGQSADLVLVGADEVLHLEIERHLIDLQAQFRSAQRKREFLAQQDRRPVRLVLVVEDTVRNRDRAGPHVLWLRSQLPANSRQVTRAIRSGEPLGRDGLMWLRRRPSLRPGGPERA